MGCVMFKNKKKQAPVVRCTVVLLRSQRDKLEREALRRKLAGDRTASLSSLAREAIGFFLRSGY